MAAWVSDTLKWERLPSSAYAKPASSPISDTKTKRLKKALDEYPRTMEGLSNGRMRIGDMDIVEITEPVRKISSYFGDLELGAGRDLDINKYLNQNGEDEVTVSIELNEKSIELTVGETFQLLADVKTNTPAAPSVSWSSSQPRIASVTSGEDVDVTGVIIPGGMVTALSEGESIVTAKAATP